MFGFVVKYFGFLKTIPLLALVFDCWLKIWYLITNGPLCDNLDDIEAEVLTWPETYTSLHKYGGLQFNFEGIEIGHLHSNGILDILFNLNIKRQLILCGRVNDHHIFKRSGWISFYIRGHNDVEYAKSLLKLSYHTNQPT